MRCGAGRDADVQPTRASPASDSAERVAVVRVVDRDTSPAQALIFLALEVGAGASSLVEADYKLKALWTALPQRRPISL